MAVLFQTTVGELAVDLSAEDAPYSAYNFLKLCKAKYYNNVAFHRVEKNFLASVGAPVTADARWNVAGLGGVSADFSTLGKAKNLVQTEKTGAEDVELRGGCSFWGVQALAADKRVTLRRLTRRSPSDRSPLATPEVKREEGTTENAARRNRRDEENPVSSAPVVCPTSCSLTRESSCMSPPSLADTGEGAPPENGSAGSSISASSFSSIPVSGSCFSSTNYSASASSCSQRARKSSARKSGWDPVDSSAASSCSQETSYFSFLDFSSVSFPPFPSNPLPNAHSFLRLPLPTPSSARFCPAEPSLANDMRRKHRAKGMVGWIPAVVPGNHFGSDILQQQLGTLSAEQQRRLHGEITSLFYITLRENIDFLDKRNLTLFGRVTEGFDVLEKINQTFVDEHFVPLTVSSPFQKRCCSRNLGAAAAAAKRERTSASAAADREIGRNRVNGGTPNTGRGESAEKSSRSTRKRKGFDATTAGPRYSPRRQVAVAVAEAAREATTVAAADAVEEAATAQRQQQRQLHKKRAETRGKGKKQATVAA